MRILFALVTIVALISQTVGAPAGGPSERDIAEGDVSGREIPGPAIVDIVSRVAARKLAARPIAKPVTVKKVTPKKTTVAAKPATPKTIVKKPVAPPKIATPKKTTTAPKIAPPKKTTTVAKPATAAKKTTTAPKKTTTTTKNTTTPPKKAPTTPPQKTTAANGAVCQVKTTGKGKNKRTTTECDTTPADSCAAHTTCAACIADAKCGVSRTTYKCETGRSVLTHAISAVECAHFDQLHKTFPNGREAVVESHINAIEPHIFIGETKDTTTGRHLQSVLLKDNPGAIPNESQAFFKANAKTATRTFNVQTVGKKGKAGKLKAKTVWEDTASGGPYTEAIISDLCRVAVKLGLEHQATNGVSGRELSFVVALPFNNAKACITWQFNGGESCFPGTTQAQAGAPGSSCDKSSEAED